MGRLDGRKAVITGGASGIGEATARRFIAEGAIVTIADRDEKRGQAVAEALGADCSFFPHDVTSEASWGRIFTLAKQVNGGVDLLVNSAGISVPSSVEDASLAHWREVMSINCEGVFLGCKHGVLAMKDGGGAIVNLSSTLGAKAGSVYAAYCASKAAVLSITRTTALHCAEQGYGIRCNAVLPGATDTPMYQGYIAAAEDADAARAQFAAAHPLGRVGTAEDVVNGILYLASSEADFVTGVELPVDGGFLA